MANAVTQSLTKGVIDGTIIVQSTKSMYCKIYFDKDDNKPTINTLTLTGNTDNGTELTDNTKYTHITKVNYTLTWADNDIAQMCVKESNTECAENDWKEISGLKRKSGNIEISSTEGEKTIYAYLKDKANNISDVKTGEITLDTTNPTITLTEDNVTENSITVTVEANDTNGISSVTCKAEGNSTIVDGEYSDTDKTCIFNELESGTEYTIEGTATDKSGRSKTSTPITVTTESAGFSPTELLSGEKRPKGLSTNLLGGMYRFVGTKANVDNYICFGYSNIESDCKSETNDYMYRIIGITQDGQMKLIKNTVIREGRYYQYKWDKDYTQNITWPNSDIFKRLNGLLNGSTQGNEGNTNIFINSKTSNVQYITTTEDTTWYNKIDSTHEWLYSDLQSVSNTAVNLYNLENKISNLKVEAPIGLMYVSDYYYSNASSGTDSSNTNCYISYTLCKNSWMHISNNGKSSEYEDEWTMTRYGETTKGFYNVWPVLQNGSALSNGSHADSLIRPVFYLNSDVKISDGNGTLSEPFIIAK